MFTINVFIIYYLLTYVNIKFTYHIYIYKSKSKTLKRRGKEPDWLGTLGHEDPNSGEFPGFSFCFIYHRPGTGEAGNPEMPTDADQKSPNKSLPSLTKGPGRRQLDKTENIWTMTSSL